MVNIVLLGSSFALWQNFYLSPNLNLLLLQFLSVEWISMEGQWISGKAEPDVQISPQSRNNPTGSW